jgi:hypothetical protein
MKIKMVLTLVIGVSLLGGMGVPRSASADCDAARVSDAIEPPEASAPAPTAPKEAPPATSAESAD